MKTPRNAGAALLLVQVAVGYEWLVSGLSKLANGGFASGLGAQLGEMAKDAPSWYGGFLTGTVAAHAIAVGYLVESAEVAVGLVLLGAAAARFAGAPARFDGLVRRATAAACVVGLAMLVNFELANGGTFGLRLATDSFDEGVDLDTLLIGVNLALLTTCVGPFRRPSLSFAPDAAPRPTR